MKSITLVTLLEQIRENIKEAQAASDKQFPGVDNYMDKALQHIEMSLLNLGVPIPDLDLES